MIGSEGQRAAAPERHRHHEGLQQDGDADRRDQRCQPRRIAQAAVGDAFDQDIHQHGHRNRPDDGDRQLHSARQAGEAAVQQAQDGQADHGADHQHVAVGEINQVEHAVHHGVAEGHQRIHAAQHQSIEDLLDESFHSCLFRIDLTKTAPGLDRSAALMRFRCRHRVASYHGIPSAIIIAMF